MRILSILFFTVFTSTNLVGQASTSNELKILSWNIYMLPAFPMMTGQVKRANGIVEVLKQSDYDLICFQEAFHKKAKGIIEDGLKAQFPYQVNTRKKGFTLKANSGLWILSKYPITKIAEIEFRAKKGFDAQSKKGAILFEMEAPRKFRVIDTHLQSGVGGGRDEIRMDQCAQILNQLIVPHLDDDIPLILAGDWNTKANSKFDNDALKQLYKITNASDEFMTKTWPSKSYGDGATHRIYDLILLKDLGSVIYHFDCQIPDLKFKWKKGKDDLSDHLPVEAILTW